MVMPASKRGKVASGLALGYDEEVNDEKEALRLREYMRVALGLLSLVSDKQIPCRRL